MDVHQYLHGVVEDGNANSEHDDQRDDVACDVAPLNTEPGCYAVFDIKLHWS